MQHKIFQHLIIKSDNVSIIWGVPFHNEASSKKKTFQERHIFVSFHSKRQLTYTIFTTHRIMNSEQFCIHDTGCNRHNDMVTCYLLTKEKLFRPSWHLPHYGMALLNCSHLSSSFE